MVLHHVKEALAGNCVVWTIFGRVMAVAMDVGVNPAQFLSPNVSFASDVINDPADLVGGPDALEHQDANVEVI